MSLFLIERPKINGFFLTFQTNIRLHYALQDTERLCEISSQNQTLQETILKKDEKIKQIAEREKLSQKLSEQYASSLKQLEKKLNESEKNLKKVSETVEDKDQKNKNLTMEIQSLTEKLKSDKNCSIDQEKELLELKTKFSRINSEYEEKIKICEEKYATLNTAKESLNEEHFKLEIERNEISEKLLKVEDSLIAVNDQLAGK